MFKTLALQPTTTIIRNFTNIAEARLYLARLEEAGVRSFISNANASQLLPFSEGGIALHIYEDDVELASEIIAEMDDNMIAPIEEDYREADLDDIEFARYLNEKEKKLSEGVRGRSFWILVAVAILMLFLAAIRLGFKYY